MAAISSLRALAATALPLLTIAAAQVQAAAIDAEAVREALMKNTGLKAESVQPSPIPGLWEVFIQDRLFYVDDKVGYVFSGSIIDTKTKRTKRRNVCANLLVRTGQSGLAKMRLSKCLEKVSAR